MTRAYKTLTSDYTWYNINCKLLSFNDVCSMLLSSQRSEILKLCPGPSQHFFRLDRFVIIIFITHLDRFLVSLSSNNKKTQEKFCYRLIEIIERGNEIHTLNFPPRTILLQDSSNGKWKYLRRTIHSAYFRCISTIYNMEDAQT